jgi:hypothetical protein
MIQAEARTYESAHFEAPGTNRRHLRMSGNNAETQEDSKPQQSDLHRYS